MSDEPRAVVRVGADRLEAHLGEIPGLVPWLCALLAEHCERHEFGPTYTDAADEAFWRLTHQAALDERLDADRQLAVLVAGDAEWTQAEAEAVLRAANATRLALGPGHDDYPLLSGVVAEITAALLDEA